MDFKFITNVSLIILLMHVKMLHCKIFTLEIENFSPTAMRMPRSGASGNYTIVLRDGESVQVEFCLRAASYVSINDIVFSNDGNIDTLRTSIDNRHIGTFQSLFIQDFGNGWNQFKSSGPLNGRVMLSIGRHIITMKATTDLWGLEIDNFQLVINDDFLKYEDLMCNLYCFDIKYDTVPRRDSIPSGRFEQKSISTQCTEQDNVKVEVYHDTATNFDIIANLPKYQSFANNRQPTYENCVLASPYWVFYNQTVTSTPRTTTNGSASLTFSGTPLKTVLTVNFNFKKMTPTREIDERLTGSLIIVKLRNMPRDNVLVKPEYKKDGKWYSLRAVQFTPFTNSHTWTLPERTWHTVQENELKLYIEPGKQQVILDTIKLERRTAPDSTIELHADADVVFQAVRMGFWHHWADNPESMAIFVQNESANTKEYYKVDSLRVYAKVPWTGGYSQVFVLFQDGRVRLQAITPHGLDYIPFGSSVNIGQPQSITSERPYSPIRRINIDPSSKSMRLTYEDGSKATLRLETTFTGTTLKIRDFYFRRHRSKFPLLTFQSMWINDGNADADHVTINGDISRHIISNWDKLYGIQAVFYRKCISSHNTQAPDITIKILSQSEV